MFIHGKISYHRDLKDILYRKTMMYDRTYNLKINLKIDK